MSLLCHIHSGKIRNLCITTERAAATYEHSKNISKFGGSTIPVASSDPMPWVLVKREHNYYFVSVSNVCSLLTIMYLMLKRRLTESRRSQFHGFFPSSSRLVSNDQVGTWNLKFLDTLSSLLWINDSPAHPTLHRAKATSWFIALKSIWWWPPSWPPKRPLGKTSKGVPSVALKVSRLGTSGQ